MSWNITPSQAAVFGAHALNDRKFVDQFFYGIAERLQATGGPAPFPQNHEWDTFTISAITDNGDGTFTLTDSSKSWVTAAGHKRWTEAVPGESGVPATAPTAYDVVIDADRSGAGLSEPDQRGVIQAPIFDQPTPATTLRCTLNLALLVEQRAIASVSSLVGRKGWVIRRNGLNYTRGFVRWPNALHYAYGVVADSGPGWLKSDRALQHADSLVGKEVVYQNGVHLQRGAITAVDGSLDKLTFTGTTADAVVGAEFYVIDPGGYWQWGRTGGPVQAAHAGLTTNYYGHGYTADAPTVVGVPRLTYPVFYGTDPAFCPVDPESVILRNDADGLDVDYYVDWDNVCGPGDVYLQPNWWQCWRALWVAAYRLCGKFVRPVDFTGFAGTFIPTFTYATWLQYAGVNAVTGSTGTHSGTSMPCALGVPHVPCNLWWTILDAAGAPLLSGYESAYDGATINGPFAAVHDGKGVVASVGPTRLVPRAFCRFKDVTYFVPSLDGDPQAAVLPPSDAFPGTWTTTPASAHYLVADHDGFVGESTLARHAVADGQFARYVGHRAHDPGFPALLPADVDQPLAQYHDYGTVTRRQPAVENRIDGVLSGTATGGSNRRVVVRGANFDALDFFPATNGKTHAFTAASGSTTGCTVPGVSGTGLWSAGRFPGFAGPFVGFCVEFLMSGADFADPAAVVERRLITTGTTAGAITWVEATSASVDGKAGRIVEPYVLNPFKDLKVTLETPDGSAATVKVQGSHGDTLFIADPDFPVTPGTTYRIDRPRIGDVYKRVSGAWVTTSDMGADSRYGGSTFQTDASANLEDVVREYGLPLPTDVTFAQQVGPQQLYDAVNALKVVPVTGGSWDATGQTRDGAWHPVSTSYADWSDKVINGDPVNEPSNPSYYNHNGVITTSAVPSARWRAQGDWNWVGGVWGAPRWEGRVFRIANSFTITSPADPWPKQLQFYNFSTAPAAGTSTAYAVNTAHFDANGDPVLQDKWDLWSTVGGVGASSPVTSAALGSVAVPAAAAAPDSSALPSGTTTGQLGTMADTRGYDVTSVQVLCAYQFKFA